MAISPIRKPAHPERICWGCEKHCPAGDLACGEDKMRAPHPTEFWPDGDEAALLVAQGGQRIDPGRAASR
jgi:hypothetical protein